MLGLMARPVSPILCFCSCSLCLASWPTLLRSAHSETLDELHPLGALRSHFRIGWPAHVRSPNASLVLCSEIRRPLEGYDLVFECRVHLNVKLAQLLHWLCRLRFAAQSCTIEARIGNSVFRFECHTICDSRT